MAVKISYVDSYSYYGKCVRLENDLMEILITVDVGPRVLRFAVPGKENMMAELPELTWENGWSVLPLVGGVFTTVANWQSDTKRLKLLTLPVSASWFTYNFINHSYAMKCS